MNAKGFSAMMERYCRQKGISISELANRIGIAPSSLSRILRGNVIPSLEMLQQISVVTGIPVAMMVNTYLDVGEKTKDQELHEYLTTQLLIMEESQARAVQTLMTRLCEKAPSSETSKIREG